MGSSEFEKYREKWARLYEEEDWSSTQIAEKHECSDSTVLRHLRRHGVEIRPTDAPSGNAPAEHRFRQKFDMDPETGCWIWTGACTLGYGQFYDGSEVTQAHRFSLRHFKGEDPGEGVVKRTCGNRKCVNPDHLTLSKRPLLDDETVIEIRRRYYREDITYKALGKEYGVSKELIGRVVRGDTREDLPLWPPYGQRKLPAKRPKRITTFFSHGDYG